MGLPLRGKAKGGEEEKKGWMGGSESKVGTRSVG